MRKLTDDEIQYLDEYFTINRNIVAEISDKVYRSRGEFSNFDFRKYSKIFNEEIFDLSSSIRVRASISTKDKYLIAIDSSGRVPNKRVIELSDDIILSILRERKIDQII